MKSRRLQKIRLEHLAAIVPSLRKVKPFVQTLDWSPRKAEEKLEALLREGLNSEESQLTRDDWKAIRKETLARVAAGKRRK